MSKRFRDIGIWKKEWYRKLTPEQKCAWNYLCDECDNVGVLALDRDMANFCIGAKVNWDKMVELCNGNVEVLPNGKWFLVDFCAFQYGKLRSECIPHASYIALLHKHELFERVCGRVGQGLGKGFASAKDKDKDKDKEEEKEALRAAARLKKRMGVK